jgi:hypothetical protein
MKSLGRSAGRAIAVAVLAVALHACGGSEGEAVSAADTLTRAQKDSIAASLPIPGAGGVGAAMRARDAAQERAAAHDSLGG